MRWHQDVEVVETVAEVVGLGVGGAWAVPGPEPAPAATASAPTAATRSRISGACRATSGPAPSAAPAWYENSTICRAKG